MPHLRVLWERLQRQRDGDVSPPDERTWLQDVTVLRGLGVGLHETVA